MNLPSTQNYIQLGSTDIKISRMGIEIWSWGDRTYWGFGKDYDRGDLQDTFEYILDSGINLIDTAEVYGMGKSEKYFGEFSQGKRQSLVIATKFFPFPWRFYPGSMKWALSNSLRRLQTSHVDLYQIHMPVPPFPIEFWLKRLVGVHHAGLTKAVGVSNYNLARTKRTHEFLKARHIPLASNQLKFSLIDRQIEKSGLLDYCLENNITVIAYSPLEMGMLTGKYSSENPITGTRRYTYQYTPEYLDRLKPIIGLMHEIGKSHGGKTPAQVAINWTIQKGTVPIPGAKNVRQAKDNIAAIQWNLTPEEVAALETESDKFHHS